MNENEINEVFFAEAMDGYEELNKKLIVLEKDFTNKNAIEAIFRITHTLKANAAGMGFSDLADMAHTFEDVFSEIKSGKLLLETTIFNDLFRANDIVGALLQAAKNKDKTPIKFRGIKTKLEVLVRKARLGDDSLPEILTPQKTPTQNIDVINTELKDAIQEETIEKESKIAFSDVISIPVRKLDNLMNLVGELMIERDRVIATVSNSQQSRRNEFSRFQRITSELQYSVMDVRLVQVDILFSKFHRIVRDTATIENKKINLILEGTENEIDRNVLQIISDSLVHIVRNAISHGIESAEKRLLANKPEIGNVIIRAKSQKNKVIIEVEDDGKGIDPNIIRKKAIEKGISTPDKLLKMSDEDVIQLLFVAGFSSAEVVTSVSGRGVGMDVVKKSIDAIGGNVIIKTELGKGSIFSLELPSSMALKSTLLVGLGNTDFAIPLSYTNAVVQMHKSEIHKVANGLVATHLNKTISILFLSDFFKPDAENTALDEKTYLSTFDTIPENNRLYIIIVSYGNRIVGFVVDKLMQQKEIVEKPLSKPLNNAKFISGATILGNGNVCLVLDVPAIISHIYKS